MTDCDACYSSELRFTRSSFVVVVTCSGAKYLWMVHGRLRLVESLWF